MKELTKRFTQVHSGLGPLSTAQTHRGSTKLGGDPVQTGLAQLYSQYSLPHTGQSVVSCVPPTLTHHHLIPGPVQGEPLVGQGVMLPSINSHPGITWAYSTTHGLVPLVAGGGGLCNVSDQPFMIPQYQPSYGSYFLQHPGEQAQSQAILPTKPLPQSIYPPPSPTSPTLDTPQLQLQLPTVLPSLPLLSKVGLSQGTAAHQRRHNDTVRSPLLEQFRNNLVPCLSLSQLQGMVVEFAEDQHGSRFIQQKLETAPHRERDQVFQELLPSCLSLMTDVFGNYVIQKFFQHGSDEQRTQLLMIVLPHIESLTVQMYGCRVIQKALETVQKEQKIMILQKLESSIEDLIKDQNGNHVIQKCIEVVEPRQLQRVLDAFSEKVLVLSCHPFGCRVVQRLLEYCLPDQTEPLLEELLGQIDKLLQDQYGNYVVQHILDRGRPEHKARIVESVSGRVVSLSQHKYASNVVEKCVSEAGREQRARLIREVCQPEVETDSCPALGLMLRDQFANYVVQKMIDTGGEEELAMLMARIRADAAALHKFTYGKHILTKLENYYARHPLS